jgi:hypothetical protein
VGLRAPWLHIHLCSYMRLCRVVPFVLRRASVLRRAICASVPRGSVDIAWMDHPTPSKSVFVTIRPRCEAARGEGHLRVACDRQAEALEISGRPAAGEEGARRASVHPL